MYNYSKCTGYYESADFITTVNVQDIGVRADNTTTVYVLLYRIKDSDDCTTTVNVQDIGVRADNTTTVYVLL